MARDKSEWSVFLGGAIIGFIAGAIVTTFTSKRKQREFRTAAHTVEQLVQSRGESQTLYEPQTRSYVPVRDRRTGFENVPPSKEEIESFLARRRRLRAEGLKSEAEWPPPGGLGAGVAMLDPLLHFQNYTAVYFYLVAPPTIGPQARADLLYMTSSNTASKGCEALLSFFNTEQFNCVFRIWDWAHPDMPGGGKFVLGLDYRQLSEYLIPYQFVLDSGAELDTVCVYIVNVTRRTNGNAFQNEVYLHNHASGTRDLVWSYAFDWPDITATKPFWWGPIFETFPDPGSPQYQLSNPVGFDNAVVVQDGIQYQLTNENSTMTQPTANGLREIYTSANSNSGLVCG